VRTQMKVIFCTDFSDNATHAFREAESLAKLTNSHLYVLHVLSSHYKPEETLESDPDAAPATERLNKEYVDVTDADAEAVLRHGNVTAEVLGFAEEIGADMIVIGARGMGAVAYFFGGGGVVSKVVKNAKIPVLVVPMP
jgi:nucleotide-binding universal stress UspA family protein